MKEYQIKTVLVPTDFSETGNNAVMVAVDICEKFGAALHVLHVMESRFIVGISTEPGFSSAAVSSDIEQQSRSQLYNIYERIIKNHNIHVHIHMPDGIPFSEICNTAHAIHASMVVMGAFGASGLREFFIGTTAFNVIKHTSVPVLTIPSNFSSIDFGRILFPVRPVNQVKEKYIFVKSFLTKKSIVHIAAMCSFGELELLSGHKNELHEIILSLKQAGISYSTEMYTCNNLASKVLELSDTFKADLIAINATLDYEWRQFFVGPFTQQIVNYAKVPVLSFRNDTGTGSNPPAEATAQIRSPEPDKLFPQD